MRLTRTNRIIVLVTGSLIIFLWLFPPFYTQLGGSPYDREARGHRWVWSGDWRKSDHVDVGRLMLEFASVVVAAGILMMLVSKKPTRETMKLLLGRFNLAQRIVTILTAFALMICLFSPWVLRDIIEDVSCTVFWGLFIIALIGVARAERAARPAKHEPSTNA